MAEFTKASLSAEKLQFSLLQPEFIEEMVKVLTKGAIKYEPNNWKKCQDKSLYVDAMLRHTNKYLKGQTLDTETGCEELAHIACNLMFLHYMDRQNEL